MDADAFRKYGKEMVDFIADYWERLGERSPMPDVQPGFMRDLVCRRWRRRWLVRPTIAG